MLPMVITFDGKIFGRELPPTFSLPAGRPRDACLLSKIMSDKGGLSGIDIVHQPIQASKNRTGK